MPQEDLPSNLTYKDQSMTLEEIRRGASSLEDIPSSIDYKDQSKTIEELRNREAGTIEELRNREAGRRRQTTGSNTRTPDSHTDDIIIVSAVEVPFNPDFPAGAALQPPPASREDAEPARCFPERFMLRAALGLVTVVVVTVIAVVVVVVVGGSSGEGSNSSPAQEIFSSSPTPVPTAPTGPTSDPTMVAAACAPTIGVCSSTTDELAAVLATSEPGDVVSLCGFMSLGESVLLTQSGITLCCLVFNDCFLTTLGGFSLLRVTGENFTVRNVDFLNGGEEGTGDNLAILANGTHLIEDCTFRNALLGENVFVQTFETSLSIEVPF
jgi:hypothetical protein